MQNQYNFCSYLSQCHELWEQADLYVSRGQCEGLFFPTFFNSVFSHFVSPRFLYSIGPRVWAVDPPLQPEGPGLLHKERPEDSECLKQWGGSPSSVFSPSWPEWTGPQACHEVKRRTIRITNMNNYEWGIMDLESPGGGFPCEHIWTLAPRKLVFCNGGDSKAPIQLVMGQQCRSGLVIIRCQFADN